MSKVTIAGDANGTGVFTIAAPNGNTNRTLTLPDEAGTIDTLQRSGNVLQVVSKTFSNTTDTTSYSFVSIGGSDISITPTSASSRILVMYNIQLHMVKNNAESRVVLQLTRNGSGINTPSENIMWSTSTGSWREVFSAQFYDTPNTASATTYQLQFRSYNNDSSSIGTNAHDVSSTITVMEIAG